MNEYEIIWWVDGSRTERHLIETVEAANATDALMNKASFDHDVTGWDLKVFPDGGACLAPPDSLDQPTGYYLAELVTETD